MHSIGQSDVKVIDPTAGEKAAFYAHTQIFIPGEWRDACALPSVVKHFGSLKRLEIYEFGVYTGSSIINIRKGLQALNTSFRLIGFDSFKGLPKDEKNLPGHEHWRPGFFDASFAFNESSIYATMQRIRRITKMPEHKLILIPGFFSNSLTKHVVSKHNLQPAAYIDIDVDMYISAYQALDFMFRQNLVVPGTVIGYDDWCGSKLHLSLEDGESAAHVRITLEHKVEFMRLTHSCSSILIFQVLSIGRSAVSDVSVNALNGCPS